MKQLFCILSFVFFGISSSFFSQDITEYTFQTETGADLYDMSSSTQLLSKQLDEQKSAVASIGFDFYFERNLYTSFSVESNGLMRLGGTQISVEYSNNIGSSTNRPKLSTFWDDLSTGLNGKVHYKLFGSAPNRVLVVEFNMYYNYGVYTNYNQTSQICLYEGSNEIEFIYGNGSTNSNSATIGIGGASSSNYLARNHLTNHTFASTSPKQTINTWPGSGRKYRFIPAYNYWTGAVSSTWEDGNNWSLGFVPTHIDRALIPVTVNQPIVNSVDSVYRIVSNVGTLVTIYSGHLTTIQNIENDGEFSIHDATLTVRGDYNALEANTTMTHLNSTLEIPNTVSSFGALSIDFGTVSFQGENQSIPSGDYCNISVENLGVKSLQANVQAYGNVVIQGAGAQLDLNGSDLSVGKDLTIAEYNGLDVSNINSSVVFFNNTNSNISHVGSDEAIFKNVTVNKSAGELILQNELNISASLNLLTGIVELNGNNLVLGTTSSNATVSGGNTSSFIRAFENGPLTGKLIHHINSAGGTTYFFPVGQTSYNPVNFTLKYGILSNSTVEVWTKNTKVSSMNDNVQCYIDRSWFVEPSGISDPTYDISYQYADGEFQGDFFVELLPVKLSVGNWYAPTNSVMQGDINEGEGFHDMETNTLTWTNLTSFSEFGGAGGSTPLPVELTSFTANCDTDNIYLEWTTSSEYNSAFFDVQYSKTGEEWNPIGSIGAAGNSNTEQHYSFIDRSDVQEGYYSLLQVDVNGKEKLYGPVHVKCSKQLDNVQVFPNPSTGAFNLSISAMEESTFNMKVYNAQNQLVYAQDMHCQEGINLFYVQEAIASKGLYLITLDSQQQSFVLKHMVLE